MTVNKAIPVKQLDATPIKPYEQSGPIYIREQRGPFQRLRRMSNWILSLLFLLIPFIPYGDRQAVLFDIAELKFHFFGVSLWPQDFTLIAWVFMAGAFALFFVTTFWGRIWCGFVCPQTVWTMAFVWVEQKVEGNHNQRKKLDKGPWSARKIRLKLTKHLIWLLMSVITATAFVAYFIPATELYLDVATFSTSFWVGFWVWFFAFCTYGNAGFMREIMCTHMCPYARFQSAMFDSNTLTVSYDTARGESRGPRRRKQDPKDLGLGDCVDCNLCVEVCPTGIDIRNGLQYECINCGACVDACNQTMDKFGYARDLISFTSENHLLGKKERLLRPKMLAYASAMVIIMVLFALDIAFRVPLELNVIRDRNDLYRINADDLVENIYTLKVLNKTQEDHTYTISVEGDADFSLQGASEIFVEAGEIYSLPLSVAADPEDLAKAITEINFKTTAVGEPALTATSQSRFFRGG